MHRNRPCRGDAVRTWTHLPIREKNLFTEAFESFINHLQSRMPEELKFLFEIFTSYSDEDRAQKFPCQPKGATRAARASFINFISVTINAK